MSLQSGRNKTGTRKAAAKEEAVEWLPHAATRGPALTVIAVTGAAILFVIALWQLHNLVLLIFGAVLLSLLLLSMSGLLERLTGASHRVAVLSTVAIIATATGLFVYLLGSRVQEDLGELVERLPDLARAMESTFGFRDFTAWAETRVHMLIGDASVLSSLANLSAALAAGAVDVVLVLAGAIYFAIEPQRYRTGLVTMIPRGSARERADETLYGVGEALRLWLLGQLASMVFVWILTTIGLLAIGLPNAFTLGLIAGILEFVPFVGPIAAAVPALATALSVEPPMVFSTLAIYVGIHLAEIALLIPLIQRKAVDLPPAVTLFAVLGFGILFGPLGIFLAAPLAVASFVLVRKLWLRELLGEKTRIPGEETEDNQAQDMRERGQPT